MTTHARALRGGDRAELLDEDPRSPLVLAEISADRFAPARRRQHPDRVINVGIREQLLVNVAGGLALTGHAADRAHLRAVPGRAAVRAGQARLRPPGRRARCWSASAARSTRPTRGRTHQAPGTSRCSTRCPTGRSTCPGTPTRSRRCSARRSPATDRVYVRLDGAAQPGRPRRRRRAGHVVRRGGGADGRRGRADARRASSPPPRIST